MRMFLDDIRVPIENYDIVVRSYDEAIELVKQNGIPTFISFDHDLGFDENFTFNIHSANQIGKNNINSILNNYLLFKVRYQ